MMQEHRQQAEMAALHEQLTLVQTALTDKHASHQSLQTAHMHAQVLGSTNTLWLYALHCLSIVLPVWSCTTQPCSLTSSISCTQTACMHICWKVSA